MSPKSFGRGFRGDSHEAGEWRFKDTVKRIIPYLKPYRRKHIQGFFCIMGTNLFGVLTPLVLKYVIEDLERNITAEKLYYYSGMIVILALIAGIFRYLMRRIIISTSRLIEYDLRVSYYQHLQRLSPSYYDRQQTGDLMTRATSDIEAIRMIVGPAIMYSVDTIFTFCFALTLMFIISVPLTFTILAFIPVISSVIYFLAKRIYKYSLQVQEKYSDLNAMTQEHLSGIRVLRSYHQEEPESRIFTSLNRDYFAANMKLVKLQAVLFPLFYSIFGIGMALILYIGGKSIITGSMSLGDFVAFTAYVALLAWPIIAFGWVLNMFQRGSASMQRITRIMESQPEIRDKVPKSAVNELEGRISFKNLCLTYPGSNDQVLHDINLEVAAGSSLGIVGQVGSGKSSLISLIPRLYNYTSGKLLIDGVAIENISLEVLRRDIAVVPQDSFLFSDKLRENVLFTDPEIRDDQLMYFTDLSHLNKDVDDFPDGFDTWVGERGLTLSGGQKQRVCLSRALAADPRILILDDCFSSVDTYTETEILRKLLPTLIGKTVLIIAHRISTLQWADQIIVIHDGKIVERGTHAELLSLKGRYAGLYRKQLLEAEFKASS